MICPKNAHQTKITDHGWGGGSIYIYIHRHNCNTCCVSAWALIKPLRNGIVLGDVIHALPIWTWIRARKAFSRQMLNRKLMLTTFDNYIRTQLTVASMWLDDTLCAMMPYSNVLHLMRKSHLMSKPGRWLLAQICSAQDLPTEHVATQRRTSLVTSV